MEKELIRKRMLQKRQQIDLKEGCNKNELVFESIIHHKRFIEADIIFTYVSCKGEVDTMKLIDFSLNQSKIVAIPKVVSKTEMRFYSITALDHLEASPFGVLEPKVQGKEAIPSVNSILIIPMLAFNSKRHRIGYGKGYYDRYLTHYPDSTRIGVAYDFQKSDDFEGDSWDIPLHLIITENQVYE